MIYISISALSIEVIQTSKSIFGKEEKINSVSRKIINPDSDIASLIREALKTAYPQAINQKESKLVVADEDLLIKRIASAANGAKLNSDAVVREAEKYLTDDISNYENFYKEINNDSGGVLYTAMPLSRIKFYAEVLKEANLKLTFLSSAAFSIYALLKAVIAKGQKLIYLHYDRNLEILMLDGEGPVEVLKLKTTPKSFSADLKTALKKLNPETGPGSLEIVIGGEKALEINTEDLARETGFTVKKISMLLENALNAQKIALDTGGVPSLYFANVIGLLSLSKMTEVPNFAVDMKNILENSEIPITDKPLKHVKIDGSETKTEPAAVTMSQDSPQVIKMEVEEKTDNIVQSSPVENRENIVEIGSDDTDNVSKNRTLLIVIFVAAALILFGGFLLIGKSSIKLPFSIKPTPAPTIVIEPSLTPTPTVDPSLKRSDVKIQILNGTEKTGFAKTTADSLRELGYKSVTTGNADKNDNQSTVIRIKDAKKNYLGLIVNDIKDKFDTSTVESLEDSSSSDIVIVLGQK